LQETNHGTTSIDISLDIKMMWRRTGLTFDVFILSEAEDKECYRYVVENQDWMQPCAFLYKEN